ncbi:MAG: DUF3144 domain-containing protein [Endozoicomonas sp.]
MNNQNTQQQPEMTEEDKQNQQEIFKLADKFIALANNMNMREKKELWKIGTAFRFAAARYSSHESAVGSPNLEQDRGKLEDWINDQFKTMLTENMQMQLAIMKEEQQKQKN